MKKLQNKKGKALVLFFIWAMVWTLMPGGFARPKEAEAAITTLYITEAVGGSSTNVDITADQSGTGWSWDAESGTLTLSGFDGERIEAEGDLTVVLSGSNTITLPDTQEGYDAYGIKSGTNLTIQDDANNAEDIVDKLAITQTAFSAESLTTSCHYYGLYASNRVNITGGNVSIDIRESSDSNNTSRTMQVTGVYATTAGRTTVSNSGRLDINIEGQHIQGQGVFGTLYAQTTAPISIKVNGCPTETYQFAAKGLYASGTGNITLTAVTGWANDGKLAVEKTAGTITFNGAIRIDSNNRDITSSSNLNIASNKKFTEPTEKTGFAYYAGDDSSDPGYMLCKEDGSKVTSAKIETVENNPLTFADNPVLDMSGLKVGNLYSGKYFHGLVSGGTKNYTFSVDPEKPLPAGLQVLQNSGTTVYAYIYGTPTEACEKGTARIIVKDSSEPQQEAYIDVDYEAVTEPPKYITVGGTTFTSDTDSSDAGWTYTASTKTLKLDNYNGTGIESEEDITVVLSGSNTITLPATTEDNRIYGIKSGTNLTITDDTTNEDAIEDKLIITQTEVSVKSNYYYYGLYATNNVNITGGSVSINIQEGSGEITTPMYMTGIYAYEGKTIVSGCATLDIQVAGAHINGKGIYSILDARTTEPITVNVNGSADETYQLATKGLYASGTGNINLTAGTGWGNEGRLAVEKTAGTITFNGAIRIGANDSDMSNSANLNIASNKKFTEPTERTGFAYYAGDDLSDPGYVLCKEDGSKVTSAKIETVE
ncbi:MAG: hypothetical protein Q4B72_11660, partial [Lachnospiraceae bacterium]|nr:hypothetical protein [Lachnospiraceae bacterium]